MLHLSVPELVDLWERGAALHPLDQGLLALHAALPAVTLSRLADWPLGRRNRALLDLHRLHFGPALEGWTSCERCAERMEFGIDLQVLAGPEAADPDGTDAIEFNDRRFRLPTSRDLAESMHHADSETAARRLVDRCLADDAGPVSWTVQEVDAIGDAMAAADSLSEIRLALVCPGCGHASEETLDLARFVWSQIEARTRRSLIEVHELAGAYGWTESEILSLSPRRRAHYLDLVRR